ncbi:integrase [Polynucleobacter sphagniphilus]|uniref:tyrosine-type recombinase/integrase n=1 Tax=Polynucleobacter sphagniphilus TaxID=1743169 RepID=UPI00247310FC|nr:tyrosine-type recombinase/integrase [Polynucleobacter sphagniphilus]MDH6301214.1 integrase [Polynucleobacter sphagniphilus]
MLERRRTLKSGKVWIGYYYSGRDENNRRIEIPLGTDLNEAKRKWAELDCKPVPAEVGTMRIIFDRYEKEVIPTKSRSTQKNNGWELAKLRSIFDSAPIEQITPQHIAQYRDARRTPAKVLKDGTIVPEKLSPVSANRELALFSHAWNFAREWGYTSKANPCLGIRKNKEFGRSFYADDEVWNSVYTIAPTELKDAMDLAYLTGQRVSDVLKFNFNDIANNALNLKQGKTGKLLQIALVNDAGENTELGQLIDRLKIHPVKRNSLLTTIEGKKLTKGMLRLRFNKARDEANHLAKKNGQTDLAERIAQFQFRDSRPKAASEIKDLGDASRLLGHSDKQITKTVYRRVGERVNPTK